MSIKFRAVKCKRLYLMYAQWPHFSVAVLQSEPATFFINSLLLLDSTDFLRLPPARHAPSKAKLRHQPISKVTRMHFYFFKLFPDVILLPSVLRPGPNVFYLTPSVAYLNALYLLDRLPQAVNLPFNFSAFGFMGGEAPTKSLAEGSLSGFQHPYANFRHLALELQFLT